MKKLICALIGAAALVASAATYIQTSSTGTAPWKPVKDSVSQAHLADSALHAPPSAYADSSRTSRLADSAKRAGWAPRADSARAAGISDTAKKAGNAANSLALGGIPAAGYGTLAQDTAISKKVASDTATVLRTGIASAITTSEAYATARISDSLTANARAWTTLTAAKSSIHDTATVLRTYIGSASTTGNAATATKLATARTITTSGDVTGTPTAFDGTANITIPTALPTLLTAGSAGSATTVPTLTWDAKGRLTAAGSAAISIPHTQINDWATSVSNVYLPLTGGTLTGFLTGTSAELWTNINAHDYGPALTLHGSIYTSDANLLLRSSAGYGNFVGFSDQSKSAGLQRWNFGVENDTLQIQANSASDGIGGTLVFKLSRNGNLTIPGTLTASSLSGNSATATQLATPRTISATGDGAWSTSFDGSANATGALTLASLLTAGSAGSATTVPTLTWDAKGRLTAVGSAAISISHSQINDWSTATSSFLTANQPISLTGAVTGSGTTPIATSFANTHLAGINQDLTTTSSPTFGVASLGTWSASSSVAWFGAAGQNNNANGNSGFLQFVGGDKSVFMSAPAGGFVNLQYNSVGYLIVSASGVSIPASGLTVSGLITANGGITGNLTGHASLDIPLTGSSAIAGSLAPATNQYYDFGAPSYQWNNVMAKTFVENGTSLSGLYASLNNDNALVGQNDFAGRTITDGNLFVRSTFSTGFSVWSTNTARTLDIANTNVYIYNVVTNTQQTLPNGLYNGQVIFFKNNTQSGIVPVGSINSSSMPIEPLSTVMLVWDANNTRWF